MWFAATDMSGGGRGRRFEQSSTSVGALFERSRSQKSCMLAFEQALTLIDQVHGVSSVTPPRPILVKPCPADRSFSGKYRPAEHELWLASLHDPQQLVDTALHEAGHHLDFAVFGGGRCFASDDCVRELSSWRAAVNASAAVRELRRQLDTTAREDTKLRRRLGYLLRPRELFARSYEQWIALRANDEALLAQYAAEADEGHDAWTVEDFCEIAATFDGLFAARGLAGPQKPVRLLRARRRRMASLARSELRRPPKSTDSVFVRLDEIITSSRGLRTKMALNVRQEDGSIRTRSVSVRFQDDLVRLTGRAEYDGFELREIDGSDSGFVEFDNAIVLRVGESYEALAPSPRRSAS